jgi:putative peptide zinc metalloprotease protein
VTTLFSARWHRVAGLTPRLSTQLQVRRQQLRGERWMVLTDTVGGRHVRLNTTAYAMAARLDGQRTVQQLWDWQLAQQADPATQDELIHLLSQLHEAGLVAFDRRADFDVLLPHRERAVRLRGRGNLLAWRFRLADPSALLDRLRPLSGVLFSRVALGIWVAAVTQLLVLALLHAPALWAHGVQWLATPRFALLAALLYVPIKIVHEIAHGLAVRRWGGQVRHCGVTLMLLLPVPFVDASAASGFPLRRQRLVVSAAGIMAELSLAAVALPLWLWLEPGWLRDAAFASLVITGISALLFNANPLQRLDGYYILTDALALPNLAPRSRQWWLDRLLRRVLHVPNVDAMPVADGETPWLAAYAPLSWLSGVVIATLAVAWLGQISLPLGLLCGVLLGWQMLLRPVVRLLGQLRRVALAQAGTAQRWRRLALGGGAALAIALCLPLPQCTLVQGVVWPAEQAQLRADEEGFVAAVLVHDGQPVQPGDAVLQLTNPQLQASLERQSSRVAALQTQLVRALPGHGAAAGDAGAELSAAQAELDRLEDRVAALTVRAGVAGRVALPRAADLGGRFFKRGHLLGQVLTPEPPSVRVALPEAQAVDLRRDAEGVSVRLASAPGVRHAGVLERDGIGAVMQLPSAALSARHGGKVQTDPQDADALRPLLPVVLLDVRLDAPGTQAARLGERAWVRFDAGLAPLAWQLARAGRRQVMARFNPQM